jgi:hypothetical protein
VGTLASNRPIVVAFQEDGCRLRPLEQCRVEGDVHYAFTPYYRKETKKAERLDELFTNFAIGAVGLAGHLNRKHAIRADSELVGVLRLPDAGVLTRDKLSGIDCDEATHVIDAVHLGGFALVRGERHAVSAEANVFRMGIGGGHSESLELLTHPCRWKALSAPTQSPMRFRCLLPHKVGDLCDPLGWST